MQATRTSSEFHQAALERPLLLKDSRRFLPAQMDAIAFCAMMFQPD
jgi:hypothetical protein